jgi:hypothetical protein
MGKYIAELDAQIGGREQGGGADHGGPSGWDGNSEAGANNGGERVGDEDHDDYLEEMIQAIGAEVILKSVKGLGNLERVKRKHRR